MKRPSRKYKFSFEELSRLRAISSITFSPLALVAAIIIGVIVVFGLAALLWVATPMRNLLPHYMKDDRGRDKAELALARLDSLNRVTDVNIEYLDNLSKILDTNRVPSDSANAGALLNSLPVDSLMTSSPAERRFVATMDEREKYNLSVLSPIAAEGILFSEPVDGGIAIEDSGKSFRLRVIAPRGVGVNSIADGYVIDRYYISDASTYVLIIQHSNGFMSRYSGVGAPLVDRGDRVYSGQRITEPLRTSGRSAGNIGIEIWRNGTPLYPSDYLYRHRADGDGLLQGNVPDAGQ